MRTRTSERSLQEILKSIKSFTDNIWDEEQGNWNEIGVHRATAEKLLQDAKDLMKKFNS
ncbi:MAG: hypothetical protein HDQ88_00750 [Clostridia bacterium]|nr:hypothetical protein [Clostridia bacterium]